ncbi:MAG: hypothetical protein J0M30_14455 [Chitinophagales bacterium]|nr:hypothetical protein [Chitinophagales bacterium]
MELQSFSSIFELFATFTIAYILIDEFTPNPFVSVIAEKILRMYEPIKDVFKAMNDQIVGVKTDLANLIQREEKPENTLLAFKEAAEEKIKSRAFLNEQAEKEILTEIKQTTLTRNFAYLNFYLLMYCLLMLFWSGVYQKAAGYTDGNQKLEYMARIDTTLAIFLAGTFLFMITLWVKDISWRQPDFRKLNGNGGKRKPNGYKLAVNVWILSCILAAPNYWVDLLSFLFYNSPDRHDILILATIVLPFLNFLIYIGKGFIIASINRDYYLARAKSFEKDSNEEVQVVMNYYAACKFNPKQLTVKKRPPKEI